MIDPTLSLILRAILVVIFAVQAWLMFSLTKLLIEIHKERKKARES